MKYTISKTWDSVPHIIGAKNQCSCPVIRFPWTRVLQFILLHDYSPTFNPFNSTVTLQFPHRLFKMQEYLACGKIPKSLKIVNKCLHLVGHYFTKASVWNFMASEADIRFSLLKR